MVVSLVEGLQSFITTTEVDKLTFSNLSLPVFIL